MEQPQEPLSWKEALPKALFAATLVPALLQRSRTADPKLANFFGAQSAARFFCGGFLARTLIEKFAAEIGQPLQEKSPDTKIFNNTMLLTWTATNAIAFGLHPAIGFAAVFSTTGCETARVYSYAVKKFYKGE
jgi:hypothetical protein